MRRPHTAPSAYPYHRYGQGQSTHPASFTPSDGRWSVVWGVHRGDLMSRDHGDTIHGLADWDMVAGERNRMIAHWGSLGYYLWYAYAVSPDGIAHDLIASVSYDDGRG